jgi:zinc transport system substrate-binding protein
VPIHKRFHGHEAVSKTELEVTAMKRFNYNRVAFLFFLAAPGLCYAENASSKIHVVVSIAPQKYFVEKIGKDRVEVTVLVSPGASPATYEPKPRQMAEITRSRVFFTLGVPFERTWVPKIRAANPHLFIVPTDENIQKMPMVSHFHPEDTDTLQATSEGQGIPDPHVWLSPPLVMLQARHIWMALTRVDPDHERAYDENYKSFITELVDLDQAIRNIFEGKEGSQFMVFHPSWGYFAKAYGIRQIPIEMEGKAPKPAQLKDLITYAREKGIRVVFAQPEFSTKNAEAIAREIGGRVALISPLSPDWARNLKQAAEAFREALR